MTSSPARALIGAALVFAIALFTFGRALVRAIVVDTGDAESLPVYAPDEPTDNETPPLTRDALMLAVESDPFQPDRTRPAERYRLPGEEEATPPVEAPPPPPAPDFRLAGTVVFDGGGMALIGIGDEERLVNVGEAVGGYRLRGVSAREAVLENPFGAVTLEVAGPQQTVAVEAEEDGDDDGRRRGRSSDERQQLMQRQMMQQLMQRAREGGASPDQMQAIQRMIQSGASPQIMMRAFERMMRGGDGETVEIAPERVIRRRAPSPPPPPPGGRVPPPTR